MASHVRDAETDKLVRELARKHAIGLTEAVRLAVQTQIEGETEAIPLRERIAALRAEVLKRPPTGLDADKQFFDDLSEDF
jgi:antitoxin VapB